MWYVRGISRMAGRVALMGFLAAHMSCAPAGESEPEVGKAPEVQAGETQDLGGIRVTVPDTWVVETPSSQMRKAQYRLSAPEGGSGDGELVVFYFGPGQGGS